MDTIILIDVSPFPSRETILVTSFLLFCTPSPFWKEGRLYKFFLYIVPFSERDKNDFDRVVSPESVLVSIPLAQMLFVSFSFFFFFFFCLFNL